MERVTGIGGIFIKAKDPKGLAAWYRDNLGIPVDPVWNGCAFRWPDGQRPDRPGQTVWCIAPIDEANPGAPGFTVNYRVDDLAAMLAQLRANGCAVADAAEDCEFGKFGWVTDPEGNRLELWEPPPGS